MLSVRHGIPFSVLGALEYLDPKLAQK